MKKIILFGGESEERLVSVASAQNLIRRYSFDEIFFLSSKNEIWLEKKESVVNHQNPFEFAYKPQGELKGLLYQGDPGLNQFKNKKVFLALHGGNAENGDLQSLLESNTIYFTGSGSQASQMAFDKLKAKEIVKKQGGRVAAGFTLSLESKDWQHQIKIFLFQYKKIVIKPRESGSSFGLHFIDAQTHLDQVFEKLEKDSKFFKDYLVEEFIKGRELTVGCLDLPKGVTQLLSPSEVLVEHNRQFDYAGKYLGQGVREITPAHLNENQVRQAQKLSELAHKSLGCTGCTRTDMIMTEQNEFVFIEINTLPGLTSASFIPQQLADKSIQLESFINDQLELALCRYKNL